MGCFVFPHAVHIGHRLTVWNIRGCANVTCRHETVSQSAQGKIDTGMSNVVISPELMSKTLNDNQYFQALCATCGVLSLIFANGAGSYIFQLMDSFAGNYTLLIIAFCEVS